MVNAADEQGGAGVVYHVHAAWDPEAETWVATSDDVPGLVTGADTLEALVEKLRVLVPEMLEVNGVLPADAAATATFKLVAERIETARAVAEWPTTRPRCGASCEKRDAASNAKERATTKSGTAR